MKIAKRPRRSLAVSRGLRRRQARATADEVDRRLFLQLSTSAVIVAIAVLVSVAGGGIQEGMINTIEKNTGLEEVNAALTSMMESVPVIGNLFSGEGAVQVFSSGNELSDDSPTASYDFTLEPVEPMASPNDQPVDDTQQSGFDQSAFESLPDVSDATDGGVNSAAVSSQAQELSVFRFVRAMAGQQEEEPAGQPVQEMADSVPENCTLEYQPLPYALSLPLTGTVTSCFGSRDDPVNEEEERPFAPLPRERSSRWASTPPMGTTSWWSMRGTSRRNTPTARAFWSRRGTVSSPPQSWPRWAPPGFPPATICIWKCG